MTVFDMEIGFLTFESNIQKNCQSCAYPLRMNILVVGEELNLEECRAKFGEAHAYTLKQNHNQALKEFIRAEVVFDFTVDKEKAPLGIYFSHPQIVAFLNTAKISLLQMISQSGERPKCALFGFPGMPTFLNRPLLEVALVNPEQKQILERTCQTLGTSFHLVEDRVGLVTPRVICMIINEAYFTVQEGTASREDIDLAMKLGTNYPFGPFEWCQRIGVRQVYELLESVQADTKDERYKICPLLKKEYLLTLL